MIRLPLSPVLALAAALSMGLLPACTSVQTRQWVPTVQRKPNDLPVGASPALVERRMGPPSRVERRSGGRVVWFYDDLWWDDRSWGSWEVHFDSDARYRGWRLVDPLSNSDFNRSAFFHPPVRGSARTYLGR